MVILHINKIVDNFANNNNSGEIVFNFIQEYLKNSQKVIVSFEGISEISSSFVNSAFIELLKDFDFDYIKSNLAFRDSTKQINSLINDRFKFEVEKMTSAVIA